jgi:hypothetical protein
MKINNTQPTTLSHSTQEYAHSARTKVDRFLLGAFLLFVLSWIFVGPPIAMMELSNDELSSHNALAALERALEQEPSTTAISTPSEVPPDSQTFSALLAPSSYLTYFLGLTMCFLIGCRLIVEYFHYRRWSLQRLTKATLKEVALTTDSLDFANHPFLVFDPSIDRMTNRELSDWCNRVNEYNERQAAGLNDEDRTDELEYITTRLSGEVSPRPFLWRKRRWFLPAVYEPARWRDDIGFYFDSKNSA